MEKLNRHSELAQIPSWEALKYSERFSEAWMDKQRQIGDPLADRVISDLKVRFPIQNPEDMLTEIKRLAESEGGVYKEFINACYHIPDWANFKAMESGAKLFASHGPLVGISILAGGVIGSAFHVNAEPVFTNTGRFIVEDGVAARMTETGAILGLVPFPGEIQPGGRHHRVTMKVRVLHAAIRHWSLEKTGEDAYPVEECGLPINMADQAYAMLIFSYLNVRGLLRMGVELSREQVDSLNLLWRYIGYVVGVDERCLCETIEDQKEFYLAFVKHQAKPGVVSLAALSLLDGSVGKLPSWSSNFLSGTLRSLTAYLGGTDFLQGLQLEERGSKTGFQLSMGMARVYNRVLEFPLGESFLTSFGKRSLAKRYKAFGNVADHHNYGVNVRDKLEIQKSLDGQKTKLAMKNRAA